MGGYVGYSAILFSDAFSRETMDNMHFFSLEPNHCFGDIAKCLIDLAGLSSFVEVMAGPTDASIRRLFSLGLKKVDFMLVGHDKLAYTPSLKLFENLRMVSPGTVIVVDNATFSGNKPYMEYVRTSVEEKREVVKRRESPDVFNLSKILATIDPEVRPGNPNLNYETWSMDGTGPAWNMVRQVLFLTFGTTQADLHRASLKLSNALGKKKPHHP